jgi:molybdate transport system permease protein
LNIIDKIVNAWLYSSVLLAALIIFPLISLSIYAIFNSSLSQLNNEIVFESIKLTLSTSVISLFITVVFGTPLAYLLSKAKSDFLQSLTSLIQFPIFIPPTVAGIALILLFNQSSFIGGMLASIGIEIPFTIFAVIIAQVFVSSPFYIRTLQLGLINIQPAYSESARLLGASSLRNILFVVLPNLKHSILIGILLTWSRSVGELGATLIFAGNILGITQTMPLAILSSFESSNGFDFAVIIAFISILISALVVVSISYISEKIIN